MTIGRRQALTVLATGGAGVALDSLLLPQASRAAEMRLAGAKEFTTVCNFCSCGCAMVGHVIEGKLVNLEGDPDGVVNEGSLCAKGAAAFETTPWLSPTIPVSMPSHTRSARFKSRVYA